MADEFEMEGHKLFWHLDRVREWVEGKPIVPIYIDMGLTRTCNIHCSYCYYAVPENRSKAMVPTETLVRFLGEAAEVGVRAIGFLGDGEPMIHPGVHEVVAAGARAGLDMAMSTNGTIMNADRIPDLLRALTWLRFNISAASPRTYGLVMGTDPKVFLKVIANVGRCVEAKRRENLETTIGMQMVLVEESAAEVEALAKLGRDLGVDYLVVKQCSRHGTFGYGAPVVDSRRFEELFRAAEAWSNANYQVVVKRTKMVARGRRYDRCYGCEFLPQITGAGEVYVCGNFFGNPEFFLGDINHQSFREIVEGERYRQVMAKVSTEVDVHRMCGLGCRQNEINEFLWKLRNPPKHLNFI